MPDFSIRSTAIEIMDDLDCSGEVVDQTLRELEFINAWLGGNHVTIDALKKLLKNVRSTRQIVIADLGCGGGDMLRLIHQWARKNKVDVKLVGIDANPNIIRFARENQKDFPEIGFLSMDIFSEEFRTMRFDVVIGTLFYHHFSNHQLSTFFSQLKKQVDVGFIINDIHRHSLAYHSIRFLTQLFSKSAMVKYDAPLSVLRAFTKTELTDIMREATITDFVIYWKWAFRWQVIAKLH
ncbi:methyltransferase domain-containing protein [Ohtaekwangia koreensis]|uniref:Ubiquinone/menaquinone biosynthesis C-methylase UbiE n=1 Tax=Ohtaekwangia koreensis TaxID=688867 RepID=A0A1T5LGT2_9BACT|nr:methyltransferase domain-containing protein [Ohtaekwangia koreensis]SKC75222.1 Ubiquinone/menaquinone biosynthesis C-methylase UbiE [Ohtaekwangia koreensis]